MEQIIKSLDIISDSQEFLKSNYLILNQYWIEPRVNQTTCTITNLDQQTQDILCQIEFHINLIDKEFEKIIGLAIQNQIFDQILETNTWVDLEKLFIGTFTKFNFIFGIPPQFTQPILKWIDSENGIEIGIQFVSEFKKMFGYKFLDLIDEKFLSKFLQILSHGKKLYLGHF